MKRIRHTTWLPGIAALCILCATAISCADTGNKEGSEEEQEITSLENEVIAIHDEVMPRMADINKLQKRLEEILIADTTDAELVQRVRTVSGQLGAADEAMMTWMHYYSDNLPEDLEEKRTFLEEEKVKIERVRDQMLQSIRNAETVINHVENGG